MSVAIEWYRKSAHGGDFRGQTSYASMLTLQGDVAAAASWLRRAATSAASAFLERLIADLAKSPYAALRQLAEEMRARAATQGFV